MISAIVFVAMLAYGFFIILRMAKKPSLKFDIGNFGGPSARLEDDPERWPAADGAWTTLDELQLVRLLDENWQ